MIFLYVFCVVIYSILPFPEVYLRAYEIKHVFICTRSLFFQFKIRELSVASFALCK